MLNASAAIISHPAHNDFPKITITRC
jgi:hypothetical protein